MQSCKGSAKMRLRELVGHLVVNFLQAADVGLQAGQRRQQEQADAEGVPVDKIED
jgi:hypothetical protein